MLAILSVLDAQIALFCYLPENKKHRNRLIYGVLLDFALWLGGERGTIGNVVLVPEYFEKGKWAISQNSIRIVLKSIELAGYVYIFMNSEWGKVFSKRETYGAVIDMIDPNNVKQMPIPILKDKTLMTEINNLALQASKLRTLAYYKEQEAIRVMNDEVLFLAN